METYIRKTSYKKCRRKFASCFSDLSFSSKSTVERLVNKLRAGSFYTRSQNCEKRLLVSSCLSVRPNETTRLPLDGF
jgi:hypothetical protein